MQNTQPFSVTAVIVTFNPDPDTLADILAVLVPRVNAVCVVDNNSSAQSQTAGICGGVEFYALPANLGLGKAHNLGIEYARAQGATHVLLLDQDSLPEPDMIKCLCNTAASLEASRTPYSGIGSRYRVEGSASSMEFVRICTFRFGRAQCGNSDYTGADFLISSGTLIPLAVVDEVGGMDESLFIDHIDTEWFLRARHHGFKAYGCCRAFMTHSLGERTVNIWFGRWRSVPFHKPFRYYYIFRNSLLLYKRDYLPVKWMLADWTRLAQMFLIFGVFSSQRGAVQKMLWKGVFDGVRGVAGRTIPTPGGG